MGNIMRKDAESQLIDSGISATELYNIFADLRSMYLLLDCRSEIEFNESHIDLALHCSPTTNLQLMQQLSCNKINIVVLYSGNCLSSQETTREAEKTIKKILHSSSVRVRLLTGGYSSFQSSYPFLCTNHGPHFAEGRLYPSQIADRVFLSNLGVASNMDVIVCMNISHVVNCTVDCPFATDAAAAAAATTTLGEGDAVADGNMAAAAAVAAARNGSSIVTVADDTPHEVSKLRIPVVDDRDQHICDYFEQAISFIDSALFGNPANVVLIHCKHGQSRSATIAAAWLISRGGHSVGSAISYLKSCRPRVGPNEGFVSQLHVFVEQKGLNSNR